MAEWQKYLKGRRAFVELIGEALKPEYHVDDLKGHINVYRNGGKYSHLGAIEYHRDSPTHISWVSTWVHADTGIAFSIEDPSFSWDDLKSVIAESSTALKNKHHPSTPDWVFEIDYDDCC